MANFYVESRNLPSNTHTEAESDGPKRGFSGFTRATRPGLSRAIGTLQTALRFPDGGIPRPTYSSLCTTGCATIIEENGFLFSTMLMMLVSFSTRNLTFTVILATRIAGLRSPSESISPKPRMGRFS